VLSGDSLFVGDVARTDLAVEKSLGASQIFDSVHAKLLTLPEETIVVPGHGPNTTIGREKERNPFLQGI